MVVVDDVPPLALSTTSILLHLPVSFFLLFFVLSSARVLSSRLAERGVGKSDKGSLILTTTMLAAGYEDQSSAGLSVGPAPRPT